MNLIEEYKQEILGQISALKEGNNDEEINTLIKEYETKLRKEYQDKKDEEIKSLEIKYSCLCELEKREEATKEVEAAEAELSNEGAVESANI